MVKFGILPSLIIEDLPVYESYIEGKMTKMPLLLKDIEPMSVWSQYILTCVDLLMYMHGEDRSISLRLWMITPGLDMFT